MMKKPIAMIGFGYLISMNSPTFSSDNLSLFPDNDLASSNLFKQPKVWYEGLEIECIAIPDDGPYEAVLCTDATFMYLLQRLLKLTSKESIEIQNLPKIDYKPLSLSHTNEPLFDLSNWLVVNEAEGYKLSNETNDLFIISTYDLFDCVGLTIWSSQATVFAHVSQEDLGRDTGMDLLIDNIPLNEREQAKVVLVSGSYSENFCDVYNFLRNQGFRNIAADVTPCIISNNHDKRYVKASSLNTFLPAYEHTDPAVLENDVQKYFPVPGARVLIVNNKTQEVYSMKNEPEKHLETLILDEWKIKYKCKRKFKWSMLQALKHKGRLF